jgi:hypothetical protein
VEKIVPPNRSRFSKTKAAKALRGTDIMGLVMTIFQILLLSGAIF